MNRRLSGWSAFAAALVLPACLSFAAEDPQEQTFNYATGLRPELDAVCRGMGNSQDCAQAIEKYQLALRPAGISRSGRTLTILPGSAPPVLLVDPETRDRNLREYSYLDTYTVPGFHLVQVQLWEDQHFLLVNAVTGSVLELRGLPVLSPNGTRFVTGWKTSVGVLSRSEGEIQIWRFDEGGPKLEWRHETVGFEPESFEWIADREIRTVLYGMRSAKARMHLRFREGVWHAEEQQPLP